MSQQELLAKLEQQKKEEEKKLKMINFADADGIKKVKPSFFGYRPPKWAHDFEYVRRNKGKGDPSDADTWSLYLVDRVLKKFSD